MTKRFTLNDLDNIQDNNPKGRLYILTERGGVNALCNLINGLNDKSNRLENENKQLKQFKFNTLKLIDKNIKKYQNHLKMLKMMQFALKGTYGKLKDIFKL